MFLLLLPYAIQIAFIIHALRTGKNTTWIWLLIMLPLVGGVIYFVMEIVPDLRRGRLIDPEGLVKLVDKSVTIRRLKEKVLLADTVANRLELADEYYRMGSYDEAQKLYQSQLAGIYKTDRAIQLSAAKAAYHAGRYAEAVGWFQAADAQSRIMSSELRLWFLHAKFQTNPTPEAAEALANLFEISRDCQAGLFLCRAYRQLGRADRIEKVTSVMAILVKNSRGQARSQGKKALVQAQTLRDPSQDGSP